MCTNVKPYGNRRARRRPAEKITVQEAADLLAVSRATIYRMLREKKLQSVQVRGCIRIDLAAFRKRFKMVLEA